MSVAFDLADRLRIRRTVAALNEILKLATVNIAPLEQDEITDEVPVPATILTALHKLHKRIGSVRKAVCKSNPAIASYLVVAKSAINVIRQSLRTDAAPAQCAIQTTTQWKERVVISSVFGGPHLDVAAAARVDLAVKIHSAPTCADAHLLVHAINYLDALRDIRGVATSLDQLPYLQHSASSSDHLPAPAARVSIPSDDDDDDDA